MGATRAIGIMHHEVAYAWGLLSSGTTAAILENSTDSLNNIPLACTSLLEGVYPRGTDPRLDRNLEIP